MRICSIQKIPQKAKLAKPVYNHKGIETPKWWQKKK